MFDRVLLILLILLLPLGIVVSRVMTGELTIGSSASGLDEKKIESLITKLSNQQSANPTQIKDEFNYTAVILASESGILKISGMAPSTQGYVWYWVASSPKSEAKKVSSQSANRLTAEPSGPFLLNPQGGGLFILDLDVKQISGIVEVRFEQGRNSSMVRFDLERNKQL